MSVRGRDTIKMTENEMTIQELQKKKKECDAAMIVGFFMTLVIIAIFVFYLCIIWIPRTTAEATFTLYDVQTKHTSRGTGAYITTFYYKAEFVDETGAARVGHYETDRHWDDGLFADYEKKRQEMENPPPIQNGEKRVVFYNGNFSDGDGVYANSPLYLIIFGIASILCSLGLWGAITDSSKYSKLLYEASLKGN